MDCLNLHTPIHPPGPLTPDTLLRAPDTIAVNPHLHRRSAASSPAHGRGRQPCRHRAGAGALLSAGEGAAPGVTVSTEKGHKLWGGPAAGGGFPSLCLLPGEAGSSLAPHPAAPELPRPTRGHRGAMGLLGWGWPPGAPRKVSPGFRVPRADGQGPGLSQLPGLSACLVPLCPACRETSTHRPLEAAAGSQSAPRASSMSCLSCLSNAQCTLNRRAMGNKQIRPWAVSKAQLPSTAC